MYVAPLFVAGDLTLVGAVEHYDWGHTAGVKVDNCLALQVGGNYNFGAVSYRDAEDTVDSKVQFKRFSVGTGYSYPFSKRTNVYGALGYAQEKGEGMADERTPSSYVAGVGIVHKF